ncbi:unnamed protein product [Nyctereutes procyonoides]|uniref:(raccoon dog) hypothetical protein n=1 Tax=Nyctereutes procyonoides TaxID=34880 RepID=A0A811YQC5_NYCPR|nr:unnamed protein product [Nyctereutes procyonoides]
MMALEKQNSTLDQVSSCLDYLENNAHLQELLESIWQAYLEFQQLEEALSDASP